MSPDDVVDKFSGMIGKSAATAVAKKTQGTARTSTRRSSAEPYSVSALLKLLSAARSSLPRTLLNSAEEGPGLVNVRDYLYRIFNPAVYERAGKQLSRRTVVLGMEGAAMKLNLREKLSSFIDLNAFEREDLVLISNASLDMKTGELSDARGTVISRVAPSKHSSLITDYSMIRPEMRNIDIIGKVTEIGPIRYVNRLGSNGQVAAASCVITDMKASINASLWGSSAIATSRMSTSDFVKIEFCSTRERNGVVEIYANDLSRVASSKSFASQLRRKA